MRILFINNTGGGFADYMDVEADISVAKLFRKQLPDAEPSDYLIRVNRQPVSREYILQDGDRVTFTPVKIEGATAA